MPDLDPITEQPQAQETEPAEEIETVPDMLDPDLVDRLTLRIGILLLPELRNMTAGEEAPPSDRVRLAADRAIIAICERIGRACRRDLPGDRG